MLQILFSMHANVQGLSRSVSFFGNEAYMACKPMHQAQNELPGRRRGASGLSRARRACRFTSSRHRIRFTGCKLPRCLSFPRGGSVACRCQAGMHQYNLAVLSPRVAVSCRRQGERHKKQRNRCAFQHDALCIILTCR